MVFFQNLNIGFIPKNRNVYTIFCLGWVMRLQTKLDSWEVHRRLLSDDPFLILHKKVIAGISIRRWDIFSTMYWPTTIVTDTNKTAEQCNRSAKRFRQSRTENERWKAEHSYFHVFWSSRKQKYVTEPMGRSQSKIQCSQEKKHFSDDGLKNVHVRFIGSLLRVRVQP